MSYELNGFYSALKTGLSTFLGSFGVAFELVLVGRELGLALVGFGAVAGKLCGRGTAKLRRAVGPTNQVSASQVLDAGEARRLGLLVEALVQLRHVHLAQVEQLVLIVYRLAAVVGRHLEVVAHDDSLYGADLDA